MTVVESSIPAVLRERASLQPNDTAFTYLDYEQDWDGVPTTLTWSQLYRRVQNLGEQLRRQGSVGDRALILAPQGLEYIIGFLGAMQAGLVAVPLSVPYGGVHDERTISVLADTSPTVVLTTSGVIDNVHVAVQPQRQGQVAPSIVELDRLDLDTRQRPSGPRPRISANDGPEFIYLQYTSGSTRTPAGVMVSNKNVFANFEQIMGDFFVANSGVPVPGLNVVTWCPLYHDMGLLLGILMPILAGVPTVLTSPVGFLQRPARWMQLLAREEPTLSAGPNFAFEVVVRKTSDADMAGLDLGSVHSILNGSERVQPKTLQRFADRFAPFNFKPEALRPSYGMAEATVYIATRQVGDPPEIGHFDAEKLAAGQAHRCEPGSGTPLVSYGAPKLQQVRIVDTDTCRECPDGTVGEIWVNGDNIALGYWQKREESSSSFGATIVEPSDGTPEGPWLRTGDSGFYSDGELFIIGRIKDLLIVYGRNHSPDDIEATIQEITGGRIAAISVPDAHTERLVVVVEMKKRDESPGEMAEKLDTARREINAAVFNSHGLKIADLVVVAPGTIPITTSGKVRRAACVEQYRQQQFDRIA